MTTKSNLDSYEGMNLPASVLHREERNLVFGPRKFTDAGGFSRWITATVRYDDRCKNGHNTFSITAVSGRVTGLGHSMTADCWGCQHEDIAIAFPELAPFIKWHLVSTDGPMHYFANSLFWATGAQANAGHLASTCVFGAAPGDADGVGPMEHAAFGSLWLWLDRRLPGLMVEFKKAVESLGFTY